ncbi:MAG TPA: LytTR family DNA-binding domain-containing protein [Allosphingosinicella sp.]|nr:LytTR family DNA-binding domain-containing protein [Allosphingosinicella sp.]
MTALRVLMCDDEPLALDRLAGLLGQCEDVELAGQAQTGQDLLAQVEALAPDLVLLDIEMPKLDGFDVVEALSRMDWPAPATPPLIVFVTAHPEMAVDAFDSGALDFISKPVRLSRLEQALARARQAAAQREAGRRLQELSGQLDALKRARSGGEDERHLWVRRGAETLRLDVGQVDRVEAEGEYVRIHAGADSYLERGSLTETATLLEPFGFVRVHRSAVVNPTRVVSVERKRWGDLVLHLTTGAAVPVGKTYREAARRLTAGGLSLG